MRAHFKRMLLGGGALLLVAQPAMAQQAQEKYPYVSLRGGVSMAEKSRLEGEGSPFAGHSSHDTGWAAGVALGYNFGGVRLEAELSRHENGVDDFGIENAAGFALVPGTNEADSGKTRATNLMANLYYDIDFGMPLKPYLGFGMGASRVNFNNYRTGAAAFLDDSKTVFAYQGIAGMRYEISRQLDLTVDYRYFNSENPSLVDTLGRSLEGDYTTHLVMVGLSWKFGGSEPRREEPVRTVQPEPQPEPAPAPAPAPEPEPVPVPPPGPFMVHFGFDSAEITPEAARIIDEAAATARDVAPVQLVLRGHADTAGPDEYNQRLSERRAEAVRQALIQRGINGNEITFDTQGYGESRPEVQTGDGVAEPQNRRVEIVFEQN